ncbi:MAG: PKD repeat protein, partial [Luteibaculaceae bacterium]
MRSFLLLIAAVFFSTAGFSQKEVTVANYLTQEMGPWKCKQQEVMKDLLMDNPLLQEQYEKALAKRIEIKRNNPNQKAAVHSIPVVFHVLHTGEAVGVGSNISDSRIQSAIDGLNRDYRRKSNDGGIAEGAGPDMEIEFCLAGRDPNGDVHSGINRIDASAVTDYATKGITENENGAALKALSKWPTADYVNVWVVREIEDDGDHTTFNGGTLGYAYLPFNPTANALDGIVCIYFACGNDPGGSDPTLRFEKNRTITHEMGHHLGLYHPFKDETCTETDCATEGDLVCDTPPTTLNANCSQPACGGTQLVENYMDYTGEDCANMFTQGQKDRMRANLDPGGNRASLTVSSGCDPNRVEADFIADVTTVSIGGTVNFTDQSSGAVVPTSWSWDFGDGNTSTTQNPSNVYNSVGFYTVRLAVDNGVNQDTIIKQSYIQVVTPVGFCDTLTNITDQDNFTYYGITDNWGYYPGHNELNLPMYAEEFFVSSATSVTSLLIPVRIAEALSTDAKIRYIVWADDASTTGLPGTELASVEVPMANLTPNAYNSISFDDPVPVNGKFHVGMELFYGSPQDTLSFYIETKNTPAENTLSALTGQGWLETTDIFGGQVNAASGILAITSQGLA